MERFVGFLAEQYQGNWPTWLSPVQTIIIPITDRNNEYGGKILEELKKSGIRAEIDDRAETMQSKIRDAQLQKIPYMLIIGDREQEGEQVAIRTRSGENLGVMDLEEFLDKINKEIESKS